MKSNIRNFAILAHIDHGKSTLSDRFLELTNTIESRSMREQYLDSMELERERGITIKMQPVNMRYKYRDEEYKANLIDTPGHVDFSYEVSRALAAVEGAVLLVDATSGVQAQTVAHLQTALDLGLVIIPVINKIDLPQARVAETEEEILSLLSGMDYMPEDIFRVSAKSGEGTEKLLNALIDIIPPPKIKDDSPLRALIFDSVYDDYQGVVAHIRVLEGSLLRGEKINFMKSGAYGSSKEIGFFSPKRVASSVLKSGDIGYVATGLKDIQQVRIGDTITLADKNKSARETIKGYREPIPLVFSTIFPSSETKYEDMEDAFLKLRLSDSSLFFEPEYSRVLGRGMKAGFLGMLHLEIVVERLKREYGLDLLITSPSVAYRILTSKQRDDNSFKYSALPGSVFYTKHKRTLGSRRDYSSDKLFKRCYASFKNNPRRISRYRIFRQGTGESLLRYPFIGYNIWLLRLLKKRDFWFWVFVL